MGVVAPTVRGVPRCEVAQRDSIGRARRENGVGLGAERADGVGGNVINPAIQPPHLRIKLRKCSFILLLKVADIESQKRL